MRISASQSVPFSSLAFSDGAATRNTPPDTASHQRGEPGTHSDKTLTFADVQSVRNAYKLAAKFFAGCQLDIGKQKVSLCEHSFDVGLVLLLAGERGALVVAGILSNALSLPLKQEREAVHRTIQRKFGDSVASLIRAVSHPTSDPYALAAAHLKERGNAAEGRDIATLRCSIKLDLLAKANEFFKRASSGNGAEGEGGEFAGVLKRLELPRIVANLGPQIDQFVQAGVSPLLLAQFLSEARQFTSFVLGESSAQRLSAKYGERYGIGAINSPCADGSPLFPSDLVAIRRAAELSSKYFEHIGRKWGPYETIPLSMHEFEVGTLLIMAGESRDVVVAGLLHDLFEGYVQGPDLALLKSEVQCLFGERVLELIEGVTEPQKSSQEGNWLQRKMVVLRSLHRGDRDLASVACAAKISTLAAGNKMLYSGRPLTEWSSGSYHANLALFQEYAQFFRDRNVSPILLEQFELEIRRFESHRGKFTLDQQEGRAANS
ncbi:MAG: hypothetical protein QY326_03600 [Bdellovibrionota bacterium]|nr:MAG: hypothetical protein QY326_03600 [Bdellovibrionota bacterium]